MRTRVLSLAAATAVVLCAAGPALAADPPVRLSTDPYTAGGSHHATEVEPDTFSFGSTIVSAFQVGRFENGGSSNIGWAVSSDAGAHWTTDKFLTGLTTQASGPFARASDPSVAYDLKDNVWLIASLALDSSANGIGVSVNRSTDGAASFGSQVAVASASGASDFDKSWVVCDNTSSSPHYGNCYVQWDDNGDSDRIKMSTSTNGGATWSAAANTTGNATGLGGQPVVRPDGNVIVPLASADETTIEAFRSTDGGASWRAPVSVSAVQQHQVGGQIRATPLPSAEIDGAGRVYLAWEDCRFRVGCPANDIVMSTSSDGLAWSQPARVPIDATDSNVDHFVPGLGVDPSTSGASAHLGMGYYYLPDTACGSPLSCQLDVGFVSSLDGGAHWSTPQQLAGPMTVSWLVPTTEGYMFGDYISTSFANGSAHPVFALAGSPPTAGTFDEAVYTSSPVLDTSPGQPPDTKPPDTKPPVVPPTGPPALTQLRIAPTRFRAARTGPSVARALGAIVSYQASAAGSTTFSVRRAVVRHGRACGFRAKSARNRRCRRWVGVTGSFPHVDTAGANRFRFTGRLKGRRLGQGLYLLLAVPHDAAGSPGRVKHARFTVLAAGRSGAGPAAAR